MRYYQQILICALLLQLFISSWARTRFISDPWPAESPYLNELEEIENIENRRNNDNDLFDRSSPLEAKAKKSSRSNFHPATDDRRKKFYSDSANYQGGHSLQGLWAMPGRR